MPLAVPVPYTWSVGDPITAAGLNAQVRDGLTFNLNPPLCELIQASTTTTIASGSWVGIQFADGASSIQTDTYGGFSTSANTRYTAQVPGWYAVSGVVAFAPNATGVRASSIYKNGASLPGYSQNIQAATGGEVTVVATPSRAVYLNGTGDYVELRGRQTSGGNLATFINSDHSSGLHVAWLHA